MGHLLTPFKSRTVEAITAKQITPLPANADDEAAWVDRLLVVCQYLDDKPFRALVSLANLGEPCVVTCPSQFEPLSDVISLQRRCSMANLCSLCRALGSEYPQVPEQNKETNDNAADRVAPARKRK